MNEEEMIDILQNVICDEVIGTYCLEIQKTTNCSKNCEKEDCYLIQAIEGIIDLYKKEKEKNKELEKQIELDKIQRLEYQKFLVQDFISKYKINEKIEEYEEILDSPIIKEDYKKEVEHIIRVLKEVKGDN